MSKPVMTGRVLPTILPQSQTSAPKVKARMSSPARISAGDFALAVTFDPSLAYHRPVNKTTGKAYMEVISEVGGFRPLYIGNGLYVKFQLCRGNPPSETGTNAVEFED